MFCAKTQHSSCSSWAGFLRTLVTRQVEFGIDFLLEV